VGESFRRRGYLVEETGLGGKDGGIDLIVRKNGRTELVQCKHWKSQQVGASTVREMWGLVDHHRADGVSIFCIGDFTPDAAAFAEGKAIELIDGGQLLELVRDVQSPSSEAQRPTLGKERIEPTLGPSPLNVSPACPSCGTTMIQRRNRRNGEAFWGCPAYPRCRGTRHA
jgi:restriction system protein